MSHNEFVCCFVEALMDGWLGCLCAAETVCVDVSASAIVGLIDSSSMLLSALRDGNDCYDELREGWSL